MRQKSMLSTVGLDVWNAEIGPHGEGDTQYDSPHTWWHFASDAVLS
jgi:hypothetical protein